MLASLPFFLFSSCKKSTDASRFDSTTIDLTPVSGGTYIEASIGDASFLNPILATDSASSEINGLIYNGLVKYDKNLNLVGDLAESWLITNDGKTITFKIRKNIKWHDGVPFTAHDALFTYQKLIDPRTRTAFSSDYVIVQNAEVLDPYTLRVNYKIPFAPALSSWGIGMIPKHIFESSDINSHPANKKPIGTGPYKFQKWVADEKIVLLSNPDYFEGKPKIDRYIYRIIPDLSVQFLELRQGSLSTMGPTPDQFNGYKKFFTHYRKYKYPAFRYDYIAFNLKNELFKDIRVRRAIAHAINKNDIVKGVYQGLAVPATGPFPPTSWAYNHDVKDIEYSPEKSKMLLKEAGWIDSDGDGILDKNGKKFQFTLILNQGNKIRESIAQVAQNNLKHLGIDVSLRVLEWSVFIQKYIDERQFEACVLAWNVGLDPDNFSIWNSKQTQKNQYNFSSYNNPEVDRLLDLGRTTFDQKKRQEIYRRIHYLIAEDIPYVFLVTPMSLRVVHKKIQGVEQAPSGLGWNFIHWFIPQAWQDKSRLVVQ